MIQILDKHDCCGCSACVQICPKNCIVMQEDEEGFLYPSVKLDACVNCRRCEAVCPIQGSKKWNGDGKPLTAYASYILNDEKRLKSSSGGIFSALAQTILNAGGQVYGAAFDTNFLVRHIGIDDSQDLFQLQGSKYIQSRVERTYIETEKALKDGRTVLYSGTACQIAGLKTYLQVEYDCLYTVDVLCHGVPSPAVWKEYLREKELQFKSAIQAVSLRQKDNGWKDYNVEIKFSNGAVYCSPAREDAFMRLFLSDICLRPSCHKCRFKELDRPSDITLGDCWGIEHIWPEMDDDHGTSIVLTHTEKGQKLFASISEQCRSKVGDVNLLLPVTADSRKSVAAHRNRKLLFQRLESGKSLEHVLRLIKTTIKERIKNRLRI